MYILNKSLDTSRVMVVQPGTLRQVAKTDRIQPSRKTMDKHMQTLS